MKQSYVSVQEQFSQPTFRDNRPISTVSALINMFQLKADAVSKSLKDLATWTKDATYLGADEISNITTTLEDLFVFSFKDLNVSQLSLSLPQTIIIGFCKQHRSR